MRTRIPVGILMLSPGASKDLPSGKNHNLQNRMSLFPAALFHCKYFFSPPQHSFSKSIAPGGFNCPKLHFFQIQLFSIGILKIFRAYFDATTRLISLSVSFGQSLMEKLMRPILSLPRQTTRTISPSCRTSSTLLILNWLFSKYVNSFFTGEFKECEFFYRNNLSGKDHALFKIRRNNPDGIDGFVHIFLIRDADRN